MIKKNDFVEIRFTGSSQGQVFDSNIEEEVKKLDPKAKPEKLLIVVGQGMVITGLDAALEGKEYGKAYEVDIAFKEGFGPRRKEMVKVLPLKIFTEKQVHPQVGMMLTMDNTMAKVIAVSGGRVTVDFNNPLAGKDLHYSFTVVKKLEDEKERIELLFRQFFGFIPEYDLKEQVVVKGPKSFVVFITAFKEKFKELIGKDLSFEEKQGAQPAPVHNHDEPGHEGHVHEH